MLQMLRFGATTQAHLTMFHLIPTRMGGARIVRKNEKASGVCAPTSAKCLLGLGDGIAAAGAHTPFI